MILTQEQIERLRTLQESYNELVDGLSNINVDVDLSPLAKQGDNEEATNSAILSALNGIATSMYKGVVTIEQSSDATIAPNTYNVWGGVVTALTITKGTDVDGIVNSYMVRFTAGEGATITFNGFELNWYGGSVPEWVAGNTYEINIVDNIALWAEIEPQA